VCDGFKCLGIIIGVHTNLHNLKWLRNHCEIQWNSYYGVCERENGAKLGFLWFDGGT